MPLPCRTTSWPVTALAILIIGTRQYALSEALLHEASHWHLSNSKPSTTFSERSSRGRSSCPSLPIAGSTTSCTIELDIADSENSIWEDYEGWGLPDPSQKLGRARAFWLFVLRPAVGLTGIMHLFKTVRDFGYDFDLRETRLMLVAWAVVIAGAAYFTLWRELILYWLVPYTFVFSTLNYWFEVGDHYRVSGAKTRSHLNWFVEYLRFAQPRLPCLTS